MICKNCGNSEDAKKGAGVLYRPVSFAEVKVFMDRQPIGPHPAFEGHPGGKA